MNPDDGETLAAVLAYIEGFSRERDEDELSSEPPSSSRSSSDDGLSSERVVTKKDVNHNRARRRKRLELLALRHEEAVLRERLQRLQSSREARRREVGEQATPRSESLRPGLLAAWKSVVTRQFHRRQAAEEENARLKAQLIEQRHVAKTLRRIIEQQARQVAVRGHRKVCWSGPSGSNIAMYAAQHPLASSRLYSPAWKAVCSDVDPTQMRRIFHEIASDLDDVHAATDVWVKRTVSLPLSNGQFLESRIFPLSPTQLALEIVDLRLLPFAFDGVGDAYWSEGINKRCTNFEFFREHSTIENRTTVFSGKAYDDAENDASLRIHANATAEKFEHADQIVVAIASRTDKVQLEKTDVAGLQLREHYWNVFRPPEPTTRDACLLLSFGHVVLTASAHVGERRHERSDRGGVSSAE